MYLTKGPYLQDPQKDSILIRWETDLPCESAVRVSLAKRPHVPARIPMGENLGVFTGEAGTFHQVRVEGLAAGQDYYYEVLADGPDSPVLCGPYPFRTAPEPDTAFSFVLTAEHGGCGDPRNPYVDPMTRLMQAEHPDFLLSVGDLVLNGPQETDWETYLFTPFGALLPTIPLYPCVGNHEVGSNAVPDEAIERSYANYLHYFAFPRYYSFDYGCAHFVVLDCPSLFETIQADDQDAYIPKLKAPLEETEQYRFLQQDLAASDARWKFVVFHFPPHTSAIYDGRELQPFCRLFEQYGVDLVFNSHAILYERSHPIREGKLDRDGVRYVLVGGFGSFPFWFREKTNGLSAKVSSRPNYVRVVLTPFSLELQAIDYEGKLFDMLTLEKK